MANLSEVLKFESKIKDKHVWNALRWFEDESHHHKKFVIVKDEFFVHRRK